MTLSVRHLNLMLRFREATKKFYLCSATQQKMFLELQSFGFMKQDNEDFIFNTEVGDVLIDQTIREFIRVAEIIKEPT